MNIDQEAHKLKETIRNALIEFQQNTNRSFHPTVEIDIFDASCTGSKKQYQVGDVRVRVETEY